MRDLTEEEIIELAKAMGFDYTSYGHLHTGEKWFRFVLPDSMVDESDLRWIWYMKAPFAVNIGKGADILVRAGKKAKILEFQKY